MTEYIREKGLLPSWGINRIIASTPQEPLTQADFNRLGFSNWQQWLDRICETTFEEVEGQLQLAI